MIFQLLKRDPAWKVFPYFVLIFAAGAFAAEYERSIIVMPLAIATIAATTGATQSQDLAARFFAGLPIAKRAIFLSRVLAVMALIWIPALTAAAVCRALGSYGAGPFVAIGALSMPMALVYQWLWIREIRLRTWVSTIMIGSVVGWMCTAMAVFPGVIPIPFVPVLTISCVASAAIFVAAWRSVLRFREPAVRQTRNTTPVRRRIWPGFPWWLVSWWDLLLWVVLGNLTLTSAWTSALLFVWTGPIRQREQQRWLDPLPVSRRLLFRVRTAPLQIALAAGYLVGSQVGMAGGWMGTSHMISLGTGRSWPTNRVTSSCETLNVTPPIDYWKPARGSVPIVRAPWGETYQPPVVRVYGMNVYNPYATGCENSHRFMDWQYERASTDVYGRPMPVSDVGVVAVPRVRTRILNLGGILTFSMLTMFPLVGFDWWRFRHFPRWLRYGIMGAALAAFPVVFLAPIAGKGGIEAPQHAMQWLSWWLPDNLALPVALAILLPTATYWAVERMFLRTEWIAWNRVQPAGNYN